MTESKKVFSRKLEDNVVALLMMVVFLAVVAFVGYYVVKYLLLAIFSVALILIAANSKGRYGG